MVVLATWSARHSTTTGELPVLLAPDLWQDPATRSFIWLARLPTHRDEEFRLAYFALMDSFFVHTRHFGQRFLPRRVCLRP